PPAPEGRRRSRARASAERRARYGRSVAAGDLLRVRRGRRAAPGVPRATGGALVRRLRGHRTRPRRRHRRRHGHRSRGGRAESPLRGGRARVTEAAVVGRVGIDLYPNELQTPLREVRTYTRYVGGFAGNVATGLARLGVRTAIVSRVGEDGHGEFVRGF